MSGIQILATGPDLAVRGIRRIEPVIEETIREARKELQILAYLFTPKALHILNLVEEAAERGVRITMVINNLKSQPQAIKSKLKSLTKKSQNVSVFDFTGSNKEQLHAKIIVADRKRAIIGSANFTWGGMFSNYEIGVLIEDKSIWDLARVIDSLAQQSKNI